MDREFEQTAPDSFEKLRNGAIRPAELAAQYEPRLRAFVHARLGPLARHESVSDLVQSVCRQLCEHEDAVAFDVEAEFRGWLFTVALNKIRERARYWNRDKRDSDRQQSIGPDRELDDLQAVSAVITPSRVASSREELERVEHALHALPEDYREVIALSRIAGLPHNVIARRIGRTEKASRQLLGRALRRLSELLIAQERADDV